MTINSAQRYIVKATTRSCQYKTEYLLKYNIHRGAVRQIYLMLKEEIVAQQQ